MCDGIGYACHVCCIISVHVCMDVGSVPLLGVYKSFKRLTISVQSSRLVHYSCKMKTDAFWYLYYFVNICTCNNIHMYIYICTYV